MGQAQRREEVLAQALVVRLLAEHLDQPAEHAEAGVVVGELLAGREQLRHLVQHAEVLLDAVVADAGVGEDVALEAGGVVEQLAHRDPRPPRPRRRSGTPAGRCGPVASRSTLPSSTSCMTSVLVHSLVIEPIWKTESARRLDPGGLAEQPGGAVDDLAAVQHGPGRARDVVLLQQRAEPLVEPGLDVAEVAHAATLGRRPAPCSSRPTSRGRPGWSVLTRRSA